MLVFDPVFYITAVTADIANNGNFTEQGHGRSINVVTAGVSSRIIRHTHDISRMALRAAPCIFHSHSLLAQ